MNYRFHPLQEHSQNKNRKRARPIEVSGGVKGGRSNKRQTRHSVSTEVAIETDDETAVAIMITDNHDQPAEVPSGFVLPLHVGFRQSSDEDDHPRCESGDVGWDGMGCVKGSEI